MPAATMRVDLLRHLHAFLTVAECGGVRTACGRLVRAPSSVTRAIASLEKLLSIALFERSAHGMLPTAAGRLALAHARRIAALLAAVHEQALGSSERTGPVAGLEALFNERRLHLMVLLAELGRMPEVACAGAVSQPAVSQAVCRLEADLGQPLFVRGQGRMLPTASARRWAMRFVAVLAELQRLRRELATLAGVALPVVPGALVSHPPAW